MFGVELSEETKEKNIIIWVERQGYFLRRVRKQGHILSGMKRQG